MRPAAVSSRSIKDCVPRLMRLIPPRARPLLFRRVDGFRVGFERHFAIAQVKCCAQRIEHSGQIGGVEQAGRAAANIDRVNRLAGSAVGAWQACARDRARDARAISRTTART